MTKNILLLRHEQNILKGFISSGAIVYLVVVPQDNFNGHPYENGIGEVFALESINDLAELSCVAGDLRSRNIYIDEVISFREDTHFARDFLILEINEALGYRASINVRDKRVMKSEVSNSGVQCAQFVSLGGGDIKSVAQEFLHQNGLPIVLKPASSMGARGVCVCRTQTELLDALAQESVWIKPWEYMLEAYVPGHEFHFDGLWLNGEPLEFTVSRYLENRIEVNDTSVSNGSITFPYIGNENVYEDALEAQKRVNSALGIVSGVTHCEFFLNEDGFIFSEGATRFSGGPVPFAVSEHTGVDWLTKYGETSIESTVPSWAYSWRRSYRFTAWTNLRVENSQDVRNIRNFMENSFSNVQLERIDEREFGSVNRDEGGDWRTAWGVAPIVSAENEQDVLDCFEALALILRSSP